MIFKIWIIFYQVGCNAVIAIALVMYAVRYKVYLYKNITDLSLIFFVLRYIGYSHIYCAWYAFPFEALEVFTFFSLQVHIIIRKL